MAKRNFVVWDGKTVEKEPEPGEGTKTIGERSQVLAQLVFAD